MACGGINRLAGVIDKVCEVTVSVVLPEVPSELAVMVVVPTPTAVASPLLLTVATDGLDELQVACVVKSSVVPSFDVPVATNCCLPCRDMTGLTGVTVMECKPDPHANKVTANDTGSKIAETNLKFFMVTPLIKRKLYWHFTFAPRLKSTRPDPFPPRGHPPSGR